MSIEQGDSTLTINQIKNEGNEQIVSSEDISDVERSRRNIAKLVESGKLSPEQAEKLAKMQITQEIEDIHEQAPETEETIIKKENGVVDFGVDEDGRQITMKVFQPQPENWTPNFYPTKDRKYFNVGFVSNIGNEFIDPENAQATTDDNLEDAEVKAAVEAERKKLDAHLEKEKAKRHNPPEVRSEFKETDFSVSQMREIADLFNQQEKTGRGLTVVMGEAGTGKNWMIDHIAHLTERPVFRFTCDASKESPELRYLLEYTTDEQGSRTVRINSTIVEALQTEGAILELDEINTLRPDVAKSINSLFDADRAIYYGEDDMKVKAARGVVIVGLMNPSNYAGVKPLAETIKSRARILEVNYPSLHGEDANGDPILRPDEAEILYQYFPEFNGINQSDFKSLWDQVINGAESKNAQNLLNQTRQLRLIQMKTLVNIADTVREAYRQYQEEGSGSLVDFNFDLRASSDCANELASAQLPTNELEAENKVREVVKKYFIIKQEEPEAKKNIEALIGAV